MSYSSLKYFADKSYSNTEGIIGYFDFTNIENSGSSVLSGNAFSEENYLSLLIDNPLNFWSTSGTSNFDGANRLKISGGLSNNFFATIAFKNIDTGRENILFSSYENSGNGYSGFLFGINLYGYPYIKYNDNNLGETYFSHSWKINSNGLGVLYFGIDSANKFFIGSYSYEDDNVLEQSTSWNIDYNYSNSIYLGGAPNLNFTNYFSGNIDEFLIHENSAFDSIDKKLLISGIVYDVVETVITGIISGQTGTLYGDLISINQCSILVSGNSGINLEQEYTGIEYYVPSYEEFFDFNNESFSNYIYSGASGIAYRLSSSSESGIIVCSENITGYDFYEYDSGYQIQYEIKNTSIVLKRPEYLFYIYNGISFNFDLNSGDQIQIFYQKPNILLDNRSNYIFVDYDYELNAYRDINADNISGLYYNGQYQRYGSEYSGLFVNGGLYLEPLEDFITNNNLIFSNQRRFLQPEFFNNSLNSFLVGDLWLSSGINYFIESGAPSGHHINGADFSNSLVFLNGQLLISGSAYSLPNQILIDLESGQNIISVQKINIETEKINYFNQQNGISEFYFNDNYIENTALIWLNGVRLINGIDYVEI